MDKFLDKYSIPKWKQVYEKHKLVNNKQWDWSNNKNFPTKKNLGSDVFTAELTKHLKKK
jgi:hypothetical protein